MLKFNIKEHKLEELEKYGFKLVSKYYMATDRYTYYDQEQIFIDVREYDVEIIAEEDSPIKDVLPLLYDLIKDGLIVKEKYNE